MTLFLKKVTLFGLLFCLLPLLIIKVANYFYNNEPTLNTVFVWGDSQTMHGIDFEALRKETNMNIKNASHAGAGVYDFLVFANNMKHGATIVVGYSKLIFLRGKNLDYNRSGLYLQGLYLLHKNSYKYSYKSSYAFY